MCEAPYDPNYVVDKFYYDVESTGALAPEDMVKMSLQILSKKLRKLSVSLNQEVQIKQGGGAPGMGMGMGMGMGPMGGYE